MCLTRRSSMTTSPYRALLVHVLQHQEGKAERASQDLGRLGEFPALRQEADDRQPPNNWLLNPTRKPRATNGARIFAQAPGQPMKPQLRKEGMSALLNLVILGRRHGRAFGDERTGPRVLKGAPIGFHCPGRALRVRTRCVQGRRISAAKIWVNWLLSRKVKVAVCGAFDAHPRRHAAGRNSCTSPKPWWVARKAVLGADAAQTSGTPG